MVLLLLISEVTMDTNYTRHYPAGLEARGYINYRAVLLRADLLLAMNTPGKRPKRPPPIKPPGPKRPPVVPPKPGDPPVHPPAPGNPPVEPPDPDRPPVKPPEEPPPIRALH
jgi:hypothetical protein